MIAKNEIAGLDNNPSYKQILQSQFYTSIHCWEKHLRIEIYHAQLNSEAFSMRQTLEIMQKRNEETFLTQLFRIA